MSFPHHIVLGAILHRNPLTIKYKFCTLPSNTSYISKRNVISLKFLSIKLRGFGGGGAICFIDIFNAFFFLFLYVLVLKKNTISVLFYNFDFHLNKWNIVDVLHFGYFCRNPLSKKK